MDCFTLITVTYSISTYLVGCVKSKKYSPSTMLVCCSADCTQRLQVLEYRERCQHLELQLQEEHTQLLNTEVRYYDCYCTSATTTAATTVASTTTAVLLLLRYCYSYTYSFSPITTTPLATAVLLLLWYCYSYTYSFSPTTTTTPATAVLL